MLIISDDRSYSCNKAPDSFITRNTPPAPEKIIEKAPDLGPLQKCGVVMLILVANYFMPFPFCIFFIPSLHAFCRIELDDLFNAVTILWALFVGYNSFNN